MGVKAKNYTIEELTRDPIQLAFLILGVFTICIIAPFTMAISNFVQKAHLEKPEGYEFPGVEDLKLAARSTAVFACLEVFT